MLMKLGQFFLLMGILLLLAACAGAGQAQEEGLLARWQANFWPFAPAPQAIRLPPLPTGSPTEAATAAATPIPGAAELLAQGENLFALNCAPCHQPNGEGNLGKFPALNGNALVTAENPQGVIQVVLQGRNIMPSFANTLSNQEVAAILSYIRNAWNNEARLLTKEAVNDLRNE